MPLTPQNHIYLQGHGEAIGYRPPKQVMKSKYTVPADRRSHAELLHDQLWAAWKAADKRWEDTRGKSPFVMEGLPIEIEGSPELYQVLRSLDLERGEIQLFTAKEETESFLVTVFIPEFRVERFFKKIEEYRNTLEQDGNPENAPLLDRIKSIKLATLKSYWTDEEQSFPEPGEPVWWELWIRDSHPRFMKQLELVAGLVGLELGSGVLHFQDRFVRLAYGTREQLATPAEVLTVITEIRAARNDPQAFLSMTPWEQAEWIEECVERTRPAPWTSPRVCILDTGVQQVHPLLQHSLGTEDLYTFNASWGTYDHHGHGTAMAGLALYGDLQSVVRGKEPLKLSHRLESIKVIPPKGQPRNRREMYGAVIAKAVGLVEERNPDRNRVFHHAIADPIRKTLGGPTSYSAALDSIAAGADLLDEKKNGRPRLILTSAGNRVPPPGATDAIKGSHDDHLHDPAQAWNALTVGGMTNLGAFSTEEFSGHSLLLEPGTFSPTSTTSFRWNWDWALKPDIVMEAGNALVDPTYKLVETKIPSLSLLTTGVEKPFYHVQMSSAATAQASELAAAIWAKYPTIWPETVRGLMVHSARWTDQMLRMHDPEENRTEGQALLRCFGFGVPNRERALHSFENGLTILIEDQLQAYEGESYKDMHLHRFPWPKQELESIHDKQVRVKITLSYFVEPNPAERAWAYRHRYGSFGLRFDMQTSGEDEPTFRARMNQAEREVGDDESYEGDSEEWLFGPKIRTRGSIHSDVWRGQAADLLLKGVIGVAPTIGWWRERHQLGLWVNPVRYSLLISIEALTDQVDLYRPLAKVLAPTTAVAQVTA